MAIPKSRTTSQQQIYLLLIWKTTVSKHSNILPKKASWPAYVTGLSQITHLVLLASMVDMSRQRDGWD